MAILRRMSERLLAGPDRHPVKYKVGFTRLRRFPGPRPLTGCTCMHGRLYHPPTPTALGRVCRMDRLQVRHRDHVLERVVINVLGDCMAHTYNKHIACECCPPRRYKLALLSLPPPPWLSFIRTGVSGPYDCVHLPASWRRPPPAINRHSPHSGYSEMISMRREGAACICGPCKVGTVS